MTDEFDADDPSEDDPQPSRKEENLRVLRERARKADEAEKAAAAAKQELALVRAGFGDLTEKKLRALIGAHGDQEWTPDALKATAGELWGDGNDANQIPAEEQQAIQQITSAGNASPPPPATPQSELRALKIQMERIGPSALETLRPQVEEAIRKAGHQFSTGAELLSDFEPIR